jgi:crotonobetainyl-CoA:carnitine CoA-transferase CaiB-like acyl-CoA transferase
VAFADEFNTTICPANTAQTVRDDPQFEDRFTWVDRSVTGADELLFPLHLEGEELPVPARAPGVGQHTDQVLARVLGLDAAAVEDLRAKGAVA